MAITAVGRSAPTSRTGSVSVTAARASPGHQPHRDPPGEPEAGRAQAGLDPGQPPAARRTRPGRPARPARCRWCARRRPARRAAVRPARWSSGMTDGAVERRVDVVHQTPAAGRAARPAPGIRWSPWSRRRTCRRPGRAERAPRSPPVRPRPRCPPSGRRGSRSVAAAMQPRTISPANDSVATTSEIEPDRRRAGRHRVPGAPAGAGSRGSGRPGAPAPRSRPRCACRAGRTGRRRRW